MGWRVDRRNDQAVLSIGSTGKGKVTFSRPNGVVVIAWLYLTVGIGAFAANFPRLLAAEPDSFMMEVTEAVAIVAGVFLLRRKNWARWLAIAWMAFHVAISFPDLHPLVVHLLFFFVITWGLLRPEAQEYFRPRSQASG